MTHYLIIGNLNAVTYKEVFPLFKDRKMWIGWNHIKWFEQPDGSKTDKIGGLSRWFTNLTEEGVMGKYCPDQFEITGLGNSRENFEPIKDYINPKKVLKNGSEINGNAINCVLAIEVQEKPIDEIYYTSDNSKYLLAPYARVLIKKKDNENRERQMDKYCPEQFEILWLGSGHSKLTMPEEVREQLKANFDMKSDYNTNGYAILNGHQLYHRLFIKLNKEKKRKWKNRELVKKD